MEKDYLVTINNVIAQVEKLKAEVEKVRDRLQTEYDELPFETQDSEYGEELQDAIDDWRLPYVMDWRQQKTNFTMWLVILKCSRCAIVDWMTWRMRKRILRMIILHHWLPVRFTSD